MFYDDSSIIDDNDENDDDDDVEAVLACPCFKHLFWPVFITRLWMGMVANSSYSVGRFIRTFEDICETQIVDSFNHKMGAIWKPTAIWQTAWYIFHLCKRLPEIGDIGPVVMGCNLCAVPFACIHRNDVYV